MQVEYHLVLHRLFVEILVDELTELHLRHIAEGTVAVLLGIPEQRSAGETDEHHVLPHDGTHGIVQTASLRAVAFVDEHEDVFALGLEAQRVFFSDGLLQILQISVERYACAAVCGYALGVLGMFAELVDEGRYQPFLASMQAAEKVALGGGMMDVVAGIAEIG